MDIPKDRVLDACCSQLDDLRSQQNEARSTEDGVKSKALARMTSTGISSYKAHGIELIHTHLDKLRVRQVADDTGDSEDQGDLGDVEDGGEQRDESTGTEG